MTIIALRDHRLLRWGEDRDLSTGVDERPGQHWCNGLAFAPVIRLRLLVVLSAIAAAALLCTPPAGAGPRAPAVVVLGDSTAAGDGAGDYEQGTRGENGNWCHRSPHAYIHATGLAGQAINLACSGARSADVGFGTSLHYTEGSQAQRLIAIAARHRVTTVVMQVGGNDDAALSTTGVTCVRAFVDLHEPPCRATLGPLVATRMAATAPKVEAAVRDVREAMRRAGYVPATYDLVLLSYSAPITERMIGLQALHGCPYSKPDAEWGRTVLFPALAEALRGVASRTGARFLDLVRATEGYEACARAVAAEEWQRRLTVDPDAFAHGGLQGALLHVAQESFHPSAAGNRAMGGCLGEFVRGSARVAACVAGADGRAHLETRAPVPVPA